VVPLTAAPFETTLSGWRVLGRRLNPFAQRQPLPGIGDILIRSTGLSQVPHRRAALDDDHVDLLLRPPVAGFGVWTSRAGSRSSRPATGTRPRRWPSPGCQNGS